MNLLAPTKALREALAKLSPVVPKGRAVRNAGLACVRLSAGDLLDDPTIYASDGMLSARLSIEGCETIEPGEVVVDHAKLSAAAGSCPGDQVSLVTHETPGGQLRLIVQSAEMKANLSLDREIQDRLTAPDVPESSPIDTGTLFPVLSRLMALAPKEDGGSSIGGCMWDVLDGELRCVTIPGVAGALETATIGGEGISQQRLFHKDWSVIDALVKEPASFGISPFVSYWSGPGAEIWLRPAEHALREDALAPKRYVKLLRDTSQQCDVHDLDPAVVVDLQAALSAVIDLGSKGSTLRIESDGSSWTLRTLSEVDPFEWRSVHPLPSLDWRTGAPGAFLGCLKALSQKDGAATIAVVRNGEALRLERGGLTCVVAGYK